MLHHTLVFQMRQMRYLKTRSRQSHNGQGDIAGDCNSLNLIHVGNLSSSEKATDKEGIKERRLAKQQKTHLKR